MMEHKPEVLWLVGDHHHATAVRLRHRLDDNALETVVGKNARDTQQVVDRLAEVSRHGFHACDALDRVCLYPRRVVGSLGVHPREHDTVCKLRMVVDVIAKEKHGFAPDSSVLLRHEA